MAKGMEAHKTEYKGITYIVGTGADGKDEKIFYASYRRNGKRYHERIGRARRDGMTASRASRIRAARIDGKELPNVEQRREAEEAKQAEEGRWTIEKLWNQYQKDKPKPNTEDRKNKKKNPDSDKSRYNLYLRDTFGNKTPSEIIALDVSRLRRRLEGTTSEKTGKVLSPATVWGVLELFKRIVNSGVKKNLCPPLPFHVDMPKLNNQKTEDLTDEETARLVKVLTEYQGTDENGNTVHLDEDACDMMLLALVTGMRRGEIFSLKWGDLDSNRGFINIRNPKGGKDATLPMPPEAERIFNRQRKGEGTDYVFPGRGGNRRQSNQLAVNKIKRLARLPKDFRPLHGLRHVFGSMLASSGEVDMYTLQKLMTHKDPKMTQRYAHLRDETLKRASSVASRIVSGG